MDETPRHDLVRGVAEPGTPDDRDRRRTLVAITPDGTAALAEARIEERKSERLLGAVEDYDHFRRQLISMIAVAADDTEETE